MNDLGKVLRFFIDQIENGHDPREEHEYWVIAKRLLNEMSNDSKLIDELITCINGLTNDSSVLVFVNSYGDTLSNNEILLHLQSWNHANDPH